MYNFTSICQQYMPIVRKYHINYNLPDECLSDLTIAMCEFVGSYSQDYPATHLHAVLCAKALELAKRYSTGTENRIDPEQLWEIAHDNLCERDYLILRYRYHKELTSIETSKIMGLSVTRVEQIERHALRVLKRITEGVSNDPYVGRRVLQPQEAMSTRLLQFI